MRNEVGYRVRFNPPQPPQAPVYVGLPELSPVELEAYLISFEAGGVGNLPMNLSVAGTLEPSLLLDTYSGAAAAYSLRKLSNSYAGSCIEVQRGDGQYQNIGFDSNGNLDTASIKTFCDADTGGTPTVGTIRTWYDQSGNSYDATQTTATKQPKIYNGTSVITENGKPTISFDGSDDTIEIPLNVAGGNTLCAYYACTYISGPSYGPDVAVLTSTGVDNGALHYVKSNNTGASYPFYNVTNSTLFGNYDGIGSYTSGTMYLIAAEFPGSSPWSVYKNGAYEGGSNTYNTFNTTQTGFTLAFQESISRYTEANFSEVIFYTSDQSSNRTGIESNISTYYFGQDLLLDIYPSSEAAYSVRKLSKYYQGPCMKVRKDDGVDTGTDIGFDADGNLNTAAIEAHCGTYNGYVVTWYDQSGNGEDVTQNTTTSQPQIYNGTATITNNGKPALLFATDNLNNTTISATRPNTTFAVTRIDNSSGFTMTVFDGNTSSDRHALYTTSSNPSRWEAYGGGNLQGPTATSNADYLTYTLWAVFPSTSEIALNGASATTGGTGSQNLSGLNIGARYTNTDHAAGYYHEIIVFGNDQSSNRTSIESNINAYFSIYS